MSKIWSLLFVSSSSPTASVTAAIVVVGADVVVELTASASNFSNPSLIWVSKPMTPTWLDRDLTCELQSRVCRPGTATHRPLWPSYPPYRVTLLPDEEEVRWRPGPPKRLYTLLCPRPAAADGAAALTHLRQLRNFPPKMALLSPSTGELPSGACEPEDDNSRQFFGIKKLYNFRKTGPTNGLLQINDDLGFWTLTITVLKFILDATSYYNALLWKLVLCRPTKDFTIEDFPTVQISIFALP